LLKSISEQEEGGISVNIKHEFGYYKAFHHVEDDSSKSSEEECPPDHEDAFGECHDDQDAGAYILRPTSDQSFEVIQPKASALTVYESDLVTEVHAQFGAPSWINQITRLIEVKDYVEVEYVVGPIPIADGSGKEVVSRYSTSINSDGIFYTDANGREFMKRKRGDSEVFGYETPDFDPSLEPVAGNYYPVNSAIYIDDESKSLSVLVDRSQAGASLADGSLELLIQRRLLYDDGRGVGEPLNETDVGITPCPPYGNASRMGTGVIISGKHRIMIGKKSGASQARSQMDEVFSQPHIFVASEPRDIQVPFHQPGLSMAKASLPDNVMVVTYASMEDDNAFLVRLAHQYGKDESEVYSSPAYVNLQDLFPNHVIETITEKSLSANQDLSDWEKRRLQWNADAGEGLTSDSATEAVVTLKPLEIRTFEIRLHSNEGKKSHKAEEESQKSNSVFAWTVSIAVILIIGMACFYWRGAIKSTTKRACDTIQRYEVVSSRTRTSEEDAREPLLDHNTFQTRSVS